MLDSNTAPDVPDLVPARLLNEFTYDALACERSGAVAHWFDAQLAPHGTLPIGVDGPVSAMLDDAGRSTHHCAQADIGGRRHSANRGHRNPDSKPSGRTRVGDASRRRSRIFK
jgi:hypothetical protein